MDLTNDWVQNVKLEEIDRILDKLPAERQTQFQQEWAQKHSRLRKKIQQGKLKTSIILLSAYPIFIFLIESLFNIAVFPSMEVAGLVLLGLLGLVWSDSEKERDQVVRLKRELALAMYRQEFDKGSG